MGIMLCKIHGRSGLAHVCACVAGDVRAGRAARPFSDYRVGVDDIPDLLTLHLCRACAGERGLPPAGGAIDGDDWEREPERYKTTVVCVRCFLRHGGDARHGAG